MKKIFYLLVLLVFIFQINLVNSLEIKIIARVNDKIITNEDLNKEKVILKYLFGQNYNESYINNLALNNLIELNIKKIEILNNKMLISEIESNKYLKIVLNKNNKSLEDFRLKTKYKFYEDLLKEKIQIEISWNKLILNKFSNYIDINLDEIIAISSNQKSDLNFDNLILKEKNKKLQSLSEAFYNEIKNKSLIKYQ